MHSGDLVIPGVIDSDFTGEIKVLAHSPQGIISISPGDRIAQLLIIPSLHNNFPSTTATRGTAGLGSSGVDFACLTMDLKNRPMLKIKIKNREFLGLLDTGADTSIITLKDWPKEWPLQVAEQTLRGLGVATSPQRSSSVLTWKNDEGQQGTFQPYVLDHLPVNLWGRDILMQMDLVLTTEGHYSQKAQNLMVKQGHKWDKGLGRYGQGNTQPISVKGNQGRQGLGFSLGPLNKSM